MAVDFNTYSNQILTHVKLIEFWKKNVKITNYLHRSMVGKTMCMKNTYLPKLLIYLPT